MENYGAVFEEKIYKNPNYIPPSYETCYRLLSARKKYGDEAVEELERKVLDKDFKFGEVVQELNKLALEEEPVSKIIEEPTSVSTTNEELATDEEADREMEEIARDIENVGEKISIDIEKDIAEMREPKEYTMAHETLVEHGIFLKNYLDRIITHIPRMDRRESEFKKMVLVMEAVTDSLDLFLETLNKPRPAKASPARDLSNL